MIYRPKTICLAMVAVLAMLLAIASNAQAENFTASKYPAQITGTSTGQSFDAFGVTSNAPKTNSVEN